MGKKSRSQKRAQVRSGYIFGMRPGSVLRARRARNKLHVTIHVDGDHHDAFSLAGIGLELPELERLIVRLTNLRDSIVRDSTPKGESATAHEPGPRPPRTQRA